MRIFVNPDRKNPGAGTPGWQTAMAALAAMAALSAHAADDQEPTVTPYRPTVSNPAALSEPGWLEMEAGFLHTKGGDSDHATSLPYLLKYAFTPDFGVLLGGDAYIRQTDDGRRISGGGDTTLLLKQRWALGKGDDGPAFGLEYGATLPTAKKGLGSGKTDYTVNGIYSTELSGNSVDLNLNLTRIGSIEAGEGRTQLGYAASVGHTINDQWGVAAEISGTTRRSTAPTDQILFAASYTASPRVVWDAGTAFGLSHASQDWSLFGGVSILLDKIH